MKRPPISLSYGLGVDSTAMLIGLRDREVRPDVILFADTRAEKAETYAYLDEIGPWLRREGFPAVEVLEYRVKNFKNRPEYRGLEENCLTNGTLPSETFGFGSCSLKWKARAIESYLRAWAPAIEAWQAGEQVLQLIGYDASGADQKRACKAAGTYRVKPDPRFVFSYPLQSWGWDRERCKREIAEAGLPVPPKSSCFFCPNMRPAEVAELPAEKLARIVIMEARAKPRLTKVEGLWRNGRKGTRGGPKFPGSMTEFIRAEKLLPGSTIDALIAEVPTEVLAREAAYKAGQEVESWDALFDRILAPLRA